MDGAASNNSTIVRARLMHLIESGALGPEGRLPTERELCAQLSVSRRAVRLSLEALEAEGLLWRRQGKGTFAGLQPDPTGALAAAIVGETTPMDVMEARISLEPAIAALAAQRASADDIERMRQLARRTLEADDPDSAELWDGALHRSIAHAARNRPMMTMFALLDEVRATESWRELRSRARSLETLKISDSEHHAVIDAIEAGDADSASVAMRAHLGTLMANMSSTAIQVAEAAAAECELLIGMRHD